MVVNSSDSDENLSSGKAPNEFISTDELIVDLDGFEGPLDLLLTLSRTQKLDLMQISILQLAEQYLEFVEKARSLRIELAADYLVMAATLAEIKSRLMLPKDSFEDEEDDPRANLIKRLQEYQRFKTVSENIAIMPMVDRDIYVASAQHPELKIETKNELKISIDEVRDTIKEVLNRPNYKTNHLIDFEELSTQERIQILLKILSKRNIITFSKTLQKNEGKKGVVVTLLASLELAKDGYLELIQNKSSELFLKSKGI